jgi:hypothetical protein
MISDNSSPVSPSSTFQLLESANPLGAKALEHHSGPLANSNVSKILPLTTFRTIDLGGGRISGPLFSRFCAKRRVFFEVFCAPEVVHSASEDGRYFFFSLPIFFAISAINFGLRSARTLSTMFAISLVSSPVAGESSA